MGTDAGSQALLTRTPVVDGYWPLMKEARQGTQTGELTMQRSKDEALGGDPVEGGRLHEVEAVAGQGVPALLVGGDEQEVAGHGGLPFAPGWAAVHDSRTRAAASRREPC